MRPLVVRGRAERLPLPDASVDLIITSPPYFALRSYTDTPQLCDRCKELTGHGWKFYRPQDASRDLRQAWPDWDAHVAEFHKPQHYAGQIGSEPTPAEYIAALVDCTREWMRVLKPSGSIFVNLGDKYGGAAWPNKNGTGSSKLTGGVQMRGSNDRSAPARPMGRDKSLMLLPERYRIACVDQLGLTARAVIVWAKPNGLPESVTDRVRRSHEDWVHLVKQPRYFAAVDEVREPQKEMRTGSNGTARDFHTEQLSRKWNPSQNGYNPLGKLPGSVWEVATEPLQVPAGVDVDHFAAFPSEWPRRLVLGWSPSGICTACGEGRRPVVTRLESGRLRSTTTARDPSWQAINRTDWQEGVQRTITGYACACTPYTDHPGTGETSRDFRTRANPNPTPGSRLRPPQVTDEGYGVKVGPWREYHFDRWTPPPTRPSTVLDPFGGTGTTAHVAAALGRIGISVDLSGDYSRLAAHPELADRRRRKVLGLDKPVLPVIPEGQLGFDWEDVS